jgi:hypothetical protein
MPDANCDARTQRAATRTYWLTEKVVRWVSDQRTGVRATRRGWRLCRRQPKQCTPPSNQRARGADVLEVFACPEENRSARVGSWLRSSTGWSCSCRRTTPPTTTSPRCGRGARTSRRVGRRSRSDHANSRTIPGPAADTGTTAAGQDLRTGRPSPTARRQHPAAAERPAGALRHDHRLTDPSGWLNGHRFGVLILCDGEDCRSIGHAEKRKHRASYQYSRRCIDPRAPDRDRAAWPTLSTLRAEGVPVTDKAAADLTPAQHDHINFYRHLLLRHRGRTQPRRTPPLHVSA